MTNIVSSIGLVLAITVLFFKSVIYGFVLFLKLFLFLLTTYLKKSKALRLFERKLLECNIPEEAVRELKNSYDLQWKDLVKIKR